ncbi:arylacetamide deacetylase-like [Ambystoma mexicanum]|uniref:arylacetamide deacetylase-like n=1 Tax=Ambystoma mexicanum TaxID=8296 RepID=UPI0037E8F000
MASLKLLYLAIATLLLAYYLYIPLPDSIEEGWKVRLIDATFRTFGHAAGLAELLGLKHYMEVLMLMTSAEYCAPISDENVTVTDTTFNNVPVRVYLPRQESRVLRRAVIYFHGGGWCVGSAAMKPYDLLSRMTSGRLNAVVISADYRLAPHVHFPTQFEDVYTVVKFFLQKEVLAQYAVDPERIGVSGDSAGGNLAAAVAQQLQDDHEITVQLKIQALLYPALQSIDMDTPSYRENAYMPLLKKRLMVTFWSEYFTTDKSLNDAMSTNTHITLESSHLIKFANWSMLLPKEFKKDHVYRKPQHGTSHFVNKFPGILDPRAAPLLADDDKLRNLPRSYLVTCMHDVLRDDGVMYAARLKKAGVHIVHDHYDDAFHGALFFTEWPLNLSIGHRMVNRYIDWLDENL